MSVASIPQSRAYPNSETPTFDVIKHNLGNCENWTYLIPTVGAIALGILFAPNFALGLAAGTGIFAVAAVVAMTLDALGVMHADNGNSEYEKQMRDQPLMATLGAPILEEGIFRGAIQPLATRLILWLVPAAAGAFLGPGLSIAVTVSIVATAALFGIIHAFNDHKNAHIQAALATVSGLAFGLLAAQFGLGASIAAHIVNNTLATTVSNLFHTESPPAAVTETSAIRV